MTVPGNAPDASRESKSRWLYLVFAVLCVHGIAFTISLYATLGEDRQGLRELYEQLAFLPLQLGSVFALITAAGRTELEPSTRRALRWVAYGFGSLAAGSGISTIA